ncbi:MAG: 50S ribosomal protein L7/L12, partial [Clostridiales bacterium]|nr:50S ribosomal protein L7/L12 [Clostridiales bacterium]
MASEKVAKVFEDIKQFTILEVAELTKLFEEEFGVSAAVPVAAAAAPAGAAAAAAAPA